MRKFFTFILTFILCMSLFGCTNKQNTINNENDKINIVCTTYPQYNWVQEIIKGQEDNFSLVLLMDDETDLHNYQPTVQDITTINQSDLFIYIGGESDKWTNDILNEKINSLNLISILNIEDVSNEEEHHDEEHKDDEEHHHKDEHIWLSLKYANLCINEISNQIIKLDETNKEVYQTNATNYINSINELDKQYEELVNNSSTKIVLFADRFPFKYLMEDYNIEYFAAFNGCSTETEASFDTITSLAQTIDNNKLNYVFVLENSILHSSNFLISYSSLANAFTTRLPEIFSWAAVFNWDSFSRRALCLGATWFLKSTMTIIINGAIARIARASRQSI